ISDGESDDRESPDHDRKHREETGEREGEGVVAGLALAVGGQDTSWKSALGALEQTLYLRPRRRDVSPPAARAFRQTCARPSRAGRSIRCRRSEEHTSELQ